MRAIWFLLALSTLLLVGCGDSDLFWDDADGYYEGWVQINRPGLGFDDSFYATLRVWGYSDRARLWDDCGRRFDADYVDYNPWNNKLKVYFRVRETTWHPECGHEIYDWELRLAGRLKYENWLYGDIEVDIDPDDYSSEHCYMDFDPPPVFVGSFDLQREYEPDHY